MAHNTLNYANELEPSAYGGEKIIDAILKVVTEFDSGKPETIMVTERKL